MRTLVHAALLTALLVPAATPVFAADLDHYYEPPGPAMLPPPPPLPCGIYRPCFRRYPRFGYVPGYPRARPYAVPVDRYERRDYGYAYARPRIERMPPRDERGRYGEPDPRYGAAERYGEEERRRDERFSAPRDYGRYRDPYDRG